MKLLEYAENPSKSRQYVNKNKMGLFDKIKSISSNDDSCNELVEYLDQMVEMDKKLLKCSDIDQLDKQEEKIGKVFDYVKSINDSLNDQNDTPVLSKMRGKKMVNLYDNYVEQYSTMMKNARKELLKIDDDLQSAIMEKVISSFDVRKTDIESLKFVWEIDAEW